MTVDARVEADFDLGPLSVSSIVHLALWWASRAVRERACAALSLVGADDAAHRIMEIGVLTGKNVAICDSVLHSTIRSLGLQRDAEIDDASRARQQLAISCLINARESTYAASHVVRFARWNLTGNKRSVVVFAKVASKALLLSTARLARLAASLQSDDIALAENDALKEEKTKQESEVLHLSSN